MHGEVYGTPGFTTVGPGSTASKANCAVTVLAITVPSLCPPKIVFLIVCSFCFRVIPSAGGEGATSCLVVQGHF